MKKTMSGILELLGCLGNCGLYFMLWGLITVPQVVLFLRNLRPDIPSEIAAQGAVGSLPVTIFVLWLSRTIQEKWKNRRKSAIILKSQVPAEQPLQSTESAPTPPPPQLSSLPSGSVPAPAEAALTSTKPPEEARKSVSVAQRILPFFVLLVLCLPGILYFCHAWSRTDFGSVIVTFYFLIACLAESMLLFIVPLVFLFGMGALISDLISGFWNKAGKP